LNPLKVGLLTLAALASVVVMSLKITSNQSGFGKHVVYKTVMDDASGILEKTPIKVAGINAGRIRSIELEGNKALITFEITDKIKVTPDARLRVKSVGLLGDKFLDLDVGQNQGERLEAGSLIPNESAGGFDALAKDASAVLKKLSAMKMAITSLSRLLPTSMKLQKA
jgi:phospholipid/cholesterol/gamma-HCH transport system substrate-binding protein